jgi:hypothetical protein
MRAYRSSGSDGGLVIVSVLAVGMGVGGIAATEGDRPVAGPNVANLDESGGWSR